MISYNRKSCKALYTITCAIVVAFMVGYWFYKYEIEDRDIGVVDYASLEDSEDIKFPVVSLCFEEPFVDDNLRATNSNITRQTYLRYLDGEIYDDMHEQIDYENVTINLADYLMSGVITWKNRSRKRIAVDSIRHYNVFNGFNHITNTLYKFSKCFMVEYDGEEKRKVKTATFRYDKEKLQLYWPYKIWQRHYWYYLNILTIIHYPGQFYLHNLNEAMYFQPYQVEKTTAFIEDLEILKQRNSRNRKCSKHIDNYDNTVIDEILAKQRCRPPYLTTHNSYPQCNSKKKVKDSKLDLETQKIMEMAKACQRISKTKLAINNVKNEYAYIWSITIQYPEEARIITQSKDVDVHSLIGNIGGYLGLFLGYALVQLADLFFAILDFTTNHLSPRIKNESKKKANKANKTRRNYRKEMTRTV